MPNDEQVRETSFVGVVAVLDKGNVVRMVDTALTDVVDAVKQNGGKGKLKFELTVELLQVLDNNVAQVAFTPVLNVTLPKPRIMPTVMFADDSNIVTQEDPNQLKLWEEKQQNVRPMARKEQA